MPNKKQALPEKLKEGLGELLGLDINKVTVHYNSNNTAGSLQNKQLPHEAWHVVQQKKGRVKSPLNKNDIIVNSDAALDIEADRFGTAAAKKPL